MCICMLIVFTVHLQLCCIIIAACTTEFTYGRAHNDKEAGRICYDNPKVKNSSARICRSLMAEAISSILVAMFLMNFDVFIPCMNKMVMIIIR